MKGFRLQFSFLSTSLTVILFILCGIFLPVANTVTLPLNKFLRDYEPLHYDADALHESHQRSRRSISDDDPLPIHLDFNAHGREFRLRLFRDTNTFDSNTIVEFDGEVVPSDFSHIYEGYLDGEPSSFVHGSIINGIFAGQIHIGEETFYVDKSYLHFIERQPFHSFIYSSEDVVDLPSERSPSPLAGSASCGLKEDHIQDWMKKVQNSAKKSPAVKKSQFHDLNVKNPYSRYTYEVNKKRSKRDAFGSDRRMCSLLLQSDPAMWDYVKNRTGVARSDSQIRDEITAFFASHVVGISAIYNSTVFQYQSFGPYTGITFSVYRMQINSSAGCQNQAINSNPFCKPNIDVSNFLNLNSLTNHDLYCLAFVFTYRDFAQGTLGLAWVGSNSGTAGGICEKFKPFTENNQVVYKSLNTGIVTLSNYGSRVPTKVSLLTFAHEAGHGFGSPHDSGPTCAPLLSDPNNPLGNYIMYASATSGDQPNNQKFSPCSIGNMTLVIDSVVNQEWGKVNCFQATSQFFCGNRIVEGSEDCDCGFADDCHNTDNPDICCHPRDDTPTGNSSLQCTFMVNAKCSPSNGPCCNSNACLYYPESQNKSCQDATECTEESFCNGMTAKCPTPVPVKNYSLCNQNTQVCKQGDCTGSVCEKIGWSVCYLTAPANDNSFNRGLLCYVSCLNPATNTCVTTGDQNKLQDPVNKPLHDLLVNISLGSTGIRLPSGAPCDNYRGYCDVFRICRSVNEDGPLARLTNLLFSQQALSTVRDWITVHWWAVLLMGVGFVVGMGLFIKVCAVHTPSSNPKQKPARKLGELTLRRGHHSRREDTANSDTRPIHPVNQGPPAGRRKKPSSDSHNSRRSSSQNAPAGIENVEMNIPPHYDNQFANNYRI